MRRHALGQHWVDNPVLVSIIFLQLLIAPSIFAVQLLPTASGGALPGFETSLIPSSGLPESQGFRVGWRNIPSNRTLGVKPQFRANGQATTLVASTNWSGYAVSTGGQVTHIEATWVVPTVDPSSPKPAYSSTWIGIGGYSDSSLIQAGTEQDVGLSGNANYYAWYELLPAYEISLFSVSAGDTINASITYGGSSVWTITLSDQTSGRNTSFAVSYQSTFSSADWIHEATSLCTSQTSCTVQTLTQTSDAVFSSAYATVGSDTGQIGYFSDIQIVMDDGSGSLHIAADPGCLPSEDRFVVSYTDKLLQTPVLVNCQLDSTQFQTFTAAQGTTITLSYYIYDGYSSTIYGLGATIRPSGSSGVTYSDSAHDTTVAVPSGYSYQTRSFTIPNSDLGMYDWKFDLWSSTPGFSARFTTSGWSNGDLLVTSTGPTQTMISGVDSGYGYVSPYCPSPIGCSLPIGQNVSVIATPLPGWRFTRWSTQWGVSCSTNPCTFSMPNTKVTLFALFFQTSTTTTMTVSYAIAGGGNPSAPVFNYVKGGAQKSIILTSNPTPISVDISTPWSVSPNPLTGSSLSEEWGSNQTLSGRSSNTTLVFTFYHQYLLAVNLNGHGTNVLSSGGWYDSGLSVPIVIAGDSSSNSSNTRYLYGGARGSGLGSYIGSSATFTVTINAAITESISWQTQYILTVALNGYGTPTPVSGTWENSSTVIPVTISSDGSNSSGTRHVISGISGSGSGSYSSSTQGQTRFSVTMNAPITETATWATQYSLIMTSNPVGAGILTAGPAWLNSGSSAAIAANAAKGYAFSSWNGTGNGSYSGLNDPSSVTMNGPVNETANFHPLIAISLNSGWNLISLPIVPNSTSITSILKAQVATNNVVSVWSYTTSGWVSFTPPAGGSLKTMADGVGYWVLMRRNDTLYVDGYVVPPGSAPPSYSLSQGWSLVGFKPEPTVQSESVGQYLSSINGKYDPNNVWVYASTGWVRANTNYMLQPGQAMWILMTAPATIKP